MSQITIPIGDIQHKKLGQICDIKISHEFFFTGPYPVVGSGNSSNHSDRFNVIENTIIIGIHGDLTGKVFKTPGKTFVASRYCYLENINPSIDKDYLYHYLKSIQDTIREKLIIDAKLKEEQLEDIDILVPLKELQDSWVEEINSKENTIKLLKASIEAIQKDSDKVISAGLSEIVEKAFQKMKESPDQIVSLMTKSIAKNTGVKEPDIKTTLPEPEKVEEKDNIIILDEEEIIPSKKPKINMEKVSGRKKPTRRRKTEKFVAFEDLCSDKKAQKIFDAFFRVPIKDKTDWDEEIARNVEKWDEAVAYDTEQVSIKI